MTAKHFKMIAQALADAKSSDLFAEDMRRELANRIAEQFASAFPRFDTERFLVAAGVK